MCVFFKQKTAYEMRISDWSSDVCSSDLLRTVQRDHADLAAALDQDRLVSHRCCSSPVPPRLHAAGTADLGVSARRELEADHQSVPLRSEDRRVGQECVSTCSSRWSPVPSQKTI